MDLTLLTAVLGSTQFITLATTLGAFVKISLRRKKDRSRTDDQIDKLLYEIKLERQENRELKRQNAELLCKLDNVRRENND